MKPPPPTPHEYGSTTRGPGAAATAASMALPPRRSTSMAARVATGSTVAAAPPLPTAVGAFGGGVAAGAPAVAMARRRAAIAAATTRIRRMGASYPSRAAADAAREHRNPTSRSAGAEGRGRTCGPYRMAAEPTTTPHRVLILPPRIRHPVVGSAVSPVQAGGGPGPAGAGGLSAW